MRQRTAKLLLALTAVLIPWEVRAYGQDIGWGFTFSFGKYVSTGGLFRTQAGLTIESPVSIIITDSYGNQFRSLGKELELVRNLGVSGTNATYLWAVAALLAFLALGITLYLLYRYPGEWSVNQYRVVGGLFVGAGVLFVVSRFLLYNYLLFNPQSHANWFSVPFGALYVVVVGGVFLWWGGDFEGWLEA